MIEVKSIQIDLNERHLRQSLSYAANEGIDWILLFNGKQIQLYRVIFAKPIKVHAIFDFDLTNLSTISRAADNLINLCKFAITKNELENYWKRFDALSPQNLIKQVYTKEVVGAMRRRLKKISNIYFNDDEIVSSLEVLIANRHSHQKPKLIK